MVRRVERPWLRYFTGNMLAATALCLPLGVACVFGFSDFGLPLWPAVLLTPVAVGAIGWREQQRMPGPRARRWIKLGLGALIGLVLTLLEAPWRDAYDHVTFWLHSLGMSVGGALTGLWVCVANWLALKLERRGPFRDMIPSGPLIMTITSLFAGAMGGFIVAGFSLLLWTWAVADLRPDFVSIPIWISAVTAICFMPFGLLMGLFSDIGRGLVGDEGSSGGGFSWGGGASNGGSSGGSWGGGGSSPADDGDE